MNVLRARGKLLISAEYMVLHGSKALAVPLKKEQYLHRIRKENHALFAWNAYHEADCWFNALFNPSNLGIVETTDRGKAENLRKLLRATVEMNPLFQKELFEWDVDTRLDFSPSWGLGSSSTLTALVAEWAEINPLDLHFRISGGSGYDVACAIADRPIVYRLGDDGPHYQPVPFDPPFADRLWFVWLGTKQPTASHLAGMEGRINPGYEERNYFSLLTQGMLQAGELSEFRAFMEEHESRLSELIKRPRVSETLFPDLPGSVKSLGAWGGDFVMIASELEPETLTSYLDNKGFTTRFRYKDLVYDT
jgi:mevalonate kinase